MLIKNPFSPIGCYHSVAIYLHVWTKYKKHTFLSQKVNYVYLQLKKKHSQAFALLLSAKKP